MQGIMKKIGEKINVEYDGISYEGTVIASDENNYCVEVISDSGAKIIYAVDSNDNVIPLAQAGY